MQNATRNDIQKLNVTHDLNNSWNIHSHNHNHIHIHSLSLSMLKHKNHSAIKIEHGWQISRIKNNTSRKHYSKKIYKYEVVTTNVRVKAYEI